MRCRRDNASLEGFLTAGIGDNPGGRIATTQIRYRPGSKGKAEVVQRFVGGVGELTQDAAIVEADVVLVLGNDFGGVTPPAGVATSGAGIATPTTTSSVPPGSSSGNGKSGAVPPDPTACE
jgi:hypothetical protein